MYIYWILYYVDETNRTLKDTLKSKAEEYLNRASYLKTRIRKMSDDPIPAGDADIDAGTDTRKGKK